MLSNPKAMEAITEWAGQRNSGVYDFTVAKETGIEVHLGRVHGVCVEKNYQLQELDPRRKFKGRGVLIGNLNRIFESFVWSP